MSGETDDGGFEDDLAELLESATLDRAHESLTGLGLTHAESEAEARKRVSECLDLAGALREASRLLDPAKSTRDLPGMIGRYEVNQVLGEGGLSTVYLANDPRLDRLVAVKVLRELVGGVDREWIATEARALAQLDSKYLLRVLDAGEHNGVPYLVSEYVPGPGLDLVIDALRYQASAGTSIADEIPVPGAGSLARAEGLQKRRPRVRLIERLARALAASHAERVFHRDIKPGNVLLPSADRPTLIDFGLAHFAPSGGTSSATVSLMGTPAYLAPEQVDKAQTGAQPSSDQFSLAVVLYELLTLQHPFAKATREDTLRSISAAAPQPLRAVDRTIPHELEWICMKALSRAPSERYATIEAFADDLDAFLEGMAVTARRTPVLTRIMRVVRRRRLPIAAALLGALLAATGVFGSRVLGARKYVNSVLGAVAGLRGEFSDLVSPIDFEQAFVKLRILRAEADRAAVGLWSSGGKQRLEMELGEAQRSLGAALDGRLLEFAETDPLPIVRRLRLERLEERRVAWREVGQLALSNGIQSLVNAGGAKWMSGPGDEEVQLFRFDRSNQRIPHDPDQLLEPQRYRVRAERSGQLIEVDVDVLESQWRASLPASFRECTPALEWVPLGASPSIEITKGPVSLAQFYSCFSATELAYFETSLRVGRFEDSPSTAPVRASGAHAHEFALRAGCRLPEAAELAEALRASGVLARPEEKSLVLVSDRIPASSDVVSVDVSEYIGRGASALPDLTSLPFDVVDPRSVLYLVRPTRPDETSAGNF